MTLEKIFNDFPNSIFIYSMIWSTFLLSPSVLRQIFNLNFCLSKHNIKPYLVLVWVLIILSASAFSSVSRFFFSLRSAFQCFPVAPVHCSQDPQTSFFTKTFIKNEFHSTIHIFKNYFATVGLVHYSQDSQTSFFTKTFIKNEFHGTIHIFKNYFATVFSFSIFSFQ